MNLGLILTTLGTGTAVAAFIYTIIRNFRKDMKIEFEKHENRFNILEDRIFQLAMGKSLKEIMLEEKNNK